MTKKWKYIKGIEGEFSGAPKWATIKAISRGRVYFAEHNEPGGRFMFWDKGTVQTTGSEGINADLNELVAYRELVDDEEQGLNDCIGAPEASAKAGELHCDGNIHTAQLGDGDIPALIAERGARYGKFKDGAEIMQELKDVMRSVDGWSNLSPSQKEALDMIQHKIGRILNGDPNYDDNWKDVAGYATLIVNELNGEIK